MSGQKQKADLQFEGSTTLKHVNMFEIVFEFLKGVFIKFAFITLY